ncbi:hypothetical protein B0A55_13208 [Friedmanniomyces simplex]|uniref:Uncharacterized protein n=1 Tax=Friedmanniomyces simplex TaxID=329884 RepID=A0A4V5NE97_9PEZI|nr:hypothetical protein B0A55_13208 [Friedmanniomyces simplex]
MRKIASSPITTAGLELAQKETAIEQLRSAEESREPKIKNQARLIEIQNREAKEVSRRIQELDGAAKASKKVNERLKIDLTQKQDQIVRTEGNMKQLQDAIEKWERRTRAAEHQLENAKNLTVPLADEIQTQA